MRYVRGSGQELFAQTLSPVSLRERAAAHYAHMFLSSQYSSPPMEGSACCSLLVLEQVL